MKNIFFKIVFILFRWVHRTFLYFFIFFKIFVYRFFLKKIGKNLFMRTGSWIGFPWNVEIGDNFVMHRNSIIEGAGSVKIGDNVMIGPNVVILSFTHSYSDLNIPMNQQQYIYNKVIIGNDVWLGANVVVVPGIKIGDGAVVGANSVVTHDVEPYGVYCGAPARKIKSRLKNEDEKNT